MRRQQYPEMIEEALHVPNSPNSSFDALCAHHLRRFAEDGQGIAMDKELEHVFRMPHDGAWWRRGINSDLFAMHLGLADFPLYQHRNSQ